MTGDDALRVVELAILRVRDRHANAIPHSIDLVAALGAIAWEISDMQADRLRALEQSTAD